METIATVLLVLLVLLGLLGNTLLVVAVNETRQMTDSIKLLQLFKSALVITGLILCFWTDISGCGYTETSAVIICDGIKGILEDLFFYSCTWTFLAVAIVRLVVCKCKGRAAMLVTKSFAVRTVALCLTPVTASAIFRLSWTVYRLQTDKPLNGSITVMTTDTKEEFDLLSENVIFALVHLIVLIVLPLLSGSAAYGVACRMVFWRMRISEEGEQTFVSRNQQETRGHSKRILVTLVVLLSSTSFTWIFLVVVKTLSLSVIPGASQTALTTGKLIVFVMHPIGEGLFQQSKRTALVHLCKKVCPRRWRKTLPMAIRVHREERHAVSGRSICVMEEKSSPTQDHFRIREIPSTVYSESEKGADDRSQVLSNFVIEERTTEVVVHSETRRKISIECKGTCNSKGLKVRKNTVNGCFQNPSEFLQNIDIANEADKGESLSDGVSYCDLSAERNFNEPSAAAVADSSRSRHLSNPGITNSCALSDLTEAGVQKKTSVPAWFRPSVAMGMKKNWASDPARLSAAQRSKRISNPGEGLALLQSVPTSKRNSTSERSSRAKRSSDSEQQIDSGQQRKENCGQLRSAIEASRWDIFDSSQEVDTTVKYNRRSRRGTFGKVESLIHLTGRRSEGEATEKLKRTDTVDGKASEKFKTRRKLMPVSSNSKTRSISCHVGPGTSDIDQREERRRSEARLRKRASDSANKLMEITHFF